MCDGTISWPSFVEQCESLLIKSSSIGDTWAWSGESSEEGGRYLVKRCSQTIPVKHDSHCVRDDDSDEEDDMVRDDDAACLYTPSLLVTAEYHITYSSSYNVPVLYFNMYHSTGMGSEVMWLEHKPLIGSQRPVL